MLGTRGHFVRWPRELVVAYCMSTIAFSKNNPLIDANLAVHSHDFLFVSLKEATEELRRRRKDIALRNAAHEEIHVHGDFVLRHFAKPRAVLFRQVATPTHEMLRFIRFAKQANLDPLILEYYGDKFVSARNRYKRSLGKMPIYQHIGADGVVNVRHHTILDFPAVEGKPFYSIRCLHDEPLISYHHRLLSATTGLKPKTACLDATPWFGRLGLNAEKYYEKVFTLFIRDGILFENYFLTPSERPFVDSVIIPAFNTVSRIYGVQPLIVRLLPPKKELQAFWDSYPKKIERFLGKIR